MALSSGLAVTNLAVSLLVFVPSLILSDIGVGYYLATRYRQIEPYASMDDPTFSNWKTPMHEFLLIIVGLFSFLSIVLWRFSTISYQPRGFCFTQPWTTRSQDLDEHQDEGGIEDIEGDQQVEEAGSEAENQHGEDWGPDEVLEQGSQDIQNWSVDQESEDEESVAEVAPRILEPLPEICISPQTPMISSVLKGQGTPKSPVKRTTVDDLDFIQTQHPTSPRRRHSHTPQPTTTSKSPRRRRRHVPQTPHHVRPISETRRKPFHANGRQWQPLSVSKQLFRKPQGPHQAPPDLDENVFPMDSLAPPMSSLEDGGHSLNTPGETDLGSTLFQSPTPTISGQEAQTLLSELGYGVATALNASPGPRVSRHLEELDDPTNETVPAEPITEGTATSTNLNPPSAEVTSTRQEMNESGNTFCSQDSTRYRRRSIS